MKVTYGRMIIGNPDDGFTSAVIEDDLDNELGRVFELESGWFFECPDLAVLRDPELVEAIISARDELLHYVNRKGAEFPEGTTRAGASFWLMQRDDGKGFSAPLESSDENGPG